MLLRDFMKLAYKSSTLHIRDLVRGDMGDVTPDSLEDGGDNCRVIIFRSLSADKVEVVVKGYVKQAVGVLEG